MDLASRLKSPQTKALITWNNNIAASSPEQRRLRRALEREDLLQVTLDLFQTDTANYADYVLPAASFLEFNDVVMSYFNAPSQRSVELTLVAAICSSLGPALLPSGPTNKKIFSTSLRPIQLVPLCQQRTSRLLESPEGTPLATPENVLVGQRLAKGRNRLHFVNDARHC